MALTISLYPIPTNDPGAAAGSSIGRCPFARKLPSPEALRQKVLLLEEEFGLTKARGGMKSHRAAPGEAGVGRKMRGHDDSPQRAKPREPTVAPWRGDRALRSRNYRLYFAGHCISLIGHRMRHRA
jgi:hypothetical protein